MDYLLIKTLHIISATLLFGTGLGSAWYKFITDRNGDINAIAQTNRNVVLADWVFTTPAIIIQPLSGLALATMAGDSISDAWLLYSIVLYLLAGLCWLPVVVMQIRMRDLALRAMRHNSALPASYRTLVKLWILLGVVAFISLIGVYGLMVFKPQ